MKYLMQNWGRRSLVILIVSVLLSYAFYLLQMTEWAAQINAAPPVEHGELPPMALVYVISFVKVAGLILIPGVLTYGLRKIWGLRKSIKR